MGRQKLRRNGWLPNKHCFVFFSCLFVGWEKSWFTYTATTLAAQAWGIESKTSGIEVGTVKVSILDRHTLQLSKTVTTKLKKDFSPLYLKVCGKNILISFNHPSSLRKKNHSGKCNKKKAEKKSACGVWFSFSCWDVQIDSQS